MTKKSSAAQDLQTSFSNQGEEEKPVILITNDGVTAPGTENLVEAVKTWGGLCSGPG